MTELVNSKKLPSLAMLVFALPAVMQGFMHAPGGLALQGIYAEQVGIPIAALGFAILSIRIFDAVTDPLIGYFSDRWRQRHGSRKPWIAVGSVVTMVGLWFLYQPNPGADIWYFTGWYTIAYIGWTITEIPYRAWSVEVTRDYAARTRLQAWIALGATIGALAFYVVPMVSKMFGGQGGIGEVNLDTLAIAAIAVLVFVPILNVAALIYVPDGDAGIPNTTKDSPKAILRSIFRNRPLMQYVGIHAFVSVFQGMITGVVFLYVGSFMGLSAYLAVAVIVSIVSSIVMVPFWAWACNRFEKHKAWAASFAISAVATLGFALLPRGEAALVPGLILAILLNFPVAGQKLAPASILGDIVDYSAERFGHDRAGVYYSFYSIIDKSVGGVGIALGLFVLSWYGFDATATEHSSRESFGMMMAISYVPAMGMLLALPFIWRFPLNREMHANVSRKLALQRDRVQIEQ